MPEPKNKKLYEEVKNEVYRRYPQHSAYRSGLLVKEYKAKGAPAGTNNENAWKPCSRNNIIVTPT